MCGTLVATATEININAMQSREPHNPALAKYAQVGRYLADQPGASNEQAWRSLVKLLTEWTDTLELPRLSTFGISDTDFDRIIANCRGSSMTTNPIVLTDEEVRQILQQRL